MAGELQGHQIVTEGTFDNLDTGTRPNLDTQIEAIEKRAVTLLKVTATGTSKILTIGSSGPFSLYNTKKIQFKKGSKFFIVLVTELNFITFVSSGTIELK